MLSATFNMLYLVTSAICLYLSNFPFELKGANLLQYFSNPLNAFIFFNSLVALTVSVFLVSLKASYGSLTSEETKKSFMILFNKINLNFLMVYFIVGIYDTLEMFAWLAILFTSNIFIIFNSIFLGRLRTANVFTDISRLRKALRLSVFGILTLLNLAALFFGVSVLVSNVGKDIFVLLYYDNLKSVLMSVQIATQLAIYSYPLGDFSCGERADIVFNIDKVADIFLNSCDVVYILFVNYMRGFSSIIFNIIVAYKFVWSVHKIFIKIRSHIRYRAINKRLSQSFLNATKEDIEKVGRCVICCESLKEGKKLDCGHIFHLRCILNWLKYKNLCPMCRKSITIQNADSAQNAFLIGNSSLNASYERRGANTVFRLNTPRLGFLLPSINFEFHQIFSGSNIGNRQRRTEANSRAAPDTRHEQMVQNVSQIVPNVPVETIRWQLRRNNYNVTRAVNNLLD